MKLPNIPPVLHETKTKGFQVKILTGVVVGLLFEMGGYFLVRGNQTAFGWDMFIGVSTVAGFAISLVSYRNVFLILLEWEGWIGCVLASPNSCSRALTTPVFADAHHSSVTNRRYSRL